MFISNIHIDEFGFFKDRSLKGLSPNLNIIIGGNEAGKTTLLNFLRGVLFGADRNITGDYFTNSKHKPGGRLTISADNGEYIIERFFSKTKDSSFNFIRPDGSEGEIAQLNDLLGHLDGKLYNSVYAFGLDDFKIKENEVFTRIKSASTGTGPTSPYEALKQFENAASNIFTRSSHKREILTLLAQWKENRNKISELKNSQPYYDNLCNQLEISKERVAGQKHKISEHTKLLNHYHNLVSVWEIWAQLVEERKFLTKLKLNENIESHASEIEAIIIDLQKYESDIVMLEREKLDEKSELEDLHGLLHELGGEVTEENIDQLDTSITVEESLRHFQSMTAKSEMEYEKARTVLENAEKNLNSTSNRYQTAKQEIETTEKPIVSTRDELNARELDLVKLRQAVSHKEKIADKIKSLEARIQDLTDDEFEIDTPRKVIYTPAIAVSALLAIVVIAGFIAGGNYGVIALIAALVISAALFGATYLAAKRISNASNFSRDYFHRKKLLNDERNELESELESVRNKIVDIVDLRKFKLGDNNDLTNTELELKRHQEDFLNWKALQKKLAANEADLEQKQKELNESKEELETKKQIIDEVDKKWREWLGRINFPVDLSVSVSERYLLKLSEAKAKVGALKKIRKRVENQAESISFFQSRATKLLALCGFPGTTPSEITERILKLRADILEIEKKRQLEISILNKEVRLEEICGKDPEKKTALEKELSGNSKIEIEEKARAIEKEIENITAEKENAEKEIGSYSKELEIRETESPSELLLESENIKQKVRQLAEDWALNRIAAYALQKTIDEYTENRQPFIAKETSAAFKKFTDGNYKKVIFDGDSDSFNIDVLSSDNKTKNQDQLSKATLEQLYLAVRFGLIADLAQSKNTLPVIMDDILVNFDPQRVRKTASAIIEFAKKYQVLFFTCHPEIAELLEKTDNCKTIRL